MAVHGQDPHGVEELGEVLHDRPWPPSPVGGSADKPYRTTRVPGFSAGAITGSVPATPHALRVPPVDLRELIEDQAHDDPGGAGETQRVEVTSARRATRHGKCEESRTGRGVFFDTETGKTKKNSQDVTTGRRRLPVPARARVSHAGARGGSLARRDAGSLSSLSAFRVIRQMRSFAVASTSAPTALAVRRRHLVAPARRVSSRVWTRASSDEEAGAPSVATSGRGGGTPGAGTRAWRIRPPTPRTSGRSSILCSRRTRRSWPRRGTETKRRWPR